MATSMASSAESSVFYKLVDNVLGHWTALKLAIDHGMGGIDSVAKGRWLASAVEQYFFDNSGLEVDEVEDFLEDILDAEFHTLADDGSTKEISQKFCRYYRLFQDNKLYELQQILNSLPVCKVDDSSSRLSRPAAPSEPEVGSQPTSTQEISNGVTNGKAPSNAMEVDEEDDGWQTISKDRRRR